MAAGETFCAPSIIPASKSESPRVGVLPVETAVALRCARLQILNRRAERDALTVATAFVHGTSVVTRKVADYQGTGVTQINPWEFVCTKVMQAVFAPSARPTNWR